MAASASVDGQIVLWDMTANKDKKALTQVAIMLTPIVQNKRFDTELNVTTQEYNATTNELITLGTDKRLTFWSVDSKKIVT